VADSTSVSPPNGAASPGPSGPGGPLEGRPADRRGLLPRLWKRRARPAEHPEPGPRPGPGRPAPGAQRRPGGEPAAPAPAGHPPGAHAAADRCRVSGYLDPRAVDRLRGVVRSAPAVVVDVSEVDGFNSAGLGALLALQAERGGDRLVVVGLEQATARLLGLEAAGEAPSAARLIDLSAHAVEPAGPAAAAAELPGQATLSVLNEVAVLQPRAGSMSVAELGRTVREGATYAVGTFVIDLVDAGDLSPAACWELVEAAADARHGGRRVLFVNASVNSARLLESAGLPDRVYVAPRTG
jgi:anti-anti-sigma regulatory factor